MPTSSDISMMAAEARNRQAGAWMKAGIALLEENDRASLERAARLFEQAIDLRERLPLDASPTFRYGLAAGWMNRADALSRLGLTRNFCEVIRSYDAALRHLALLPWEQNALFARRLAIAWLNRAETLLAQCERAAEAMESLASGFAVLESEIGGLIEDRAALLGCAWLARARILIDRGQPDAEAALAAARISLRWLRGGEEQSEAAAEAGLKARLALCRAVSLLVDDGKPPQRNSGGLDLIGEATDIAEEGMALANLWESRGPEKFRPLTLDLFRFAARAYALWQPHFLVEFVMDAIRHATRGGRIESELRREAILVLQRSFQALFAEGFAAINSPEWRECLDQLSLAEHRLELSPPSTGLRSRAWVLK